MAKIKRRKTASKKKTVPSAQPSKPLPRTVAGLRVLLSDVKSSLRFLESVHRTQVVRLDELKKAITAPLGILERRQFLQRLAEADQDWFARTPPSARILLSYVDAGEMDRLWGEFMAARSELTPPKDLTSGCDLGPRRTDIAALGRLVAAEEGILAIYRDLQQRVITALDELAEGHADKTDKNADRNTSKRIRLPKNDSVIRLAKEINDRGDEELSQNDIARQFTGGNTTAAESLLRQLRRYPNLRSKHKQ